MCAAFVYAVALPETARVRHGWIPLVAASGRSAGRGATAAGLRGATQHRPQDAVMHAQTHN